MGLDALLRGTKITIETSVAPPLTIDVAESGGEQGLLTKVLRPRVTVWNGAQILYRTQPAGDPDSGPPWGLLLVGGAVLALVLWRAR